ncbi:MAG: hypothetical protein CMQ20_17340 [Gammaproteobacteria bacterium]|nr:hypothetical protein [Gammaproteobacteria bacterium]
MILDLIVLQGIGNKVRLLWEGAFPPSEQVLIVYEKNSRWWLPWIYFLRVFGIRPNRHKTDTE